MTVARGMAMGGEGSGGPAGCVANGHMTVGRWGKGGRGSGKGGRKGGGEERGGKGGWVGGGTGKGGGGRGGGPAGAQQGPRGGPGRGLGGGPTGGPLSPSSIKPVGWPRALKKIEIRPGPAR